MHQIGSRITATGVNFIKILRANFSYKPLFSSFSLVTWRPKRLLYAKFVCKTLRKLTTGEITTTRNNVDTFCQVPNVIASLKAYLPMFEKFHNKETQLKVIGQRDELEFCINFRPSQFWEFMTRFRNNNFDVPN